MKGNVQTQPQHRKKENRKRESVINHKIYLRILARSKFVPNKLHKYGCNVVSGCNLVPGEVLVLTLVY